MLCRHLFMREFLELVILTFDYQITHPDDDHIGNAAGFLDRMCDVSKPTPKRYIDNCKVVYCQIPQLFQKPSVEPRAPIANHLSGVYVNECTYDGRIDRMWETQMRKAGFVLNVECYPSTNRNWDLVKDNAQWDVHTKAKSNHESCTLSYKEAAVSKGLKFAVVVKIVICLPHGDLVATYRVKTEKSKLDKYESTVSRDKQALGLLLQPIRLSASQIEELTSEQTQTIEVSDWIPEGGKSKKLKTGLPKLMSNMVITDLPPPARSVRQVVDLGTKIDCLNSDSKIRTNLKVVVPQTGSPLHQNS